MAETNIVAGLFGMTPEMYQRQQYQQDLQQGYDFSRLDPGAAARAQLSAGVGQLGRGFAGAMGVEDPTLQRITQQAQLMQGLNLRDPQSLLNAAQQASQTGNTALAMNLLNLSDKAQVRLQQIQAQQEALQARAISLEAYQPGTPERAPMMDIQEREQMADQGTPMPENIPATPPSYDIRRVAPQLQALGAPGFAQLTAALTAEKAMRPEVKEIKNREKLIERTPTGGWKIIPISGQPEVSATSENAIQTLISSNAIHPSVVPYAQQISKRFTTIDPEDQDKLMQTLTQLNNTATEKEANRTAQQSTAVAANASRLLTQELIKLNIAEAKRKAEAAADGKPIGINESTKLAERAQSADKLVSIYESFKPEFAGFATDRVGDAALLIAGKSKDQKSVDLFQWWQGYQENINKVRNELFGAALTAPEKAEFEKAMVTKGMSPEQAATNLKRQAELAINAYNKIDNVLRVQGFSKEGLNALKPMGIRPGLENFVLPNPTNPASK